MTCLIGNLMNGITVLQRIRTEIVPQRLRGNHIRILIKYLVDPRRTQFPVLTADKQIWAVRVPHLQVFPDGIDNLIIKIDQPVLVTLADDPKLLGCQVNLAQLQIDALTAPDPGISIKRDNAKIPLAAVLQKCPYKKRQIYENKNRNGGCIRMIDIASILQSNERVNIEVKAAGKGIPNSIWETYSSFANTFGGAIILGMDGCW